ncbi:TIGR04282 family arsenosugar biosynthesis glycosyltransferase [Arenimonas alkanexedens]
MTGGLAIFVKTPGQSPVKTRLAKRFGRLHAEAFHLAAAEAVASVAVRAGLTAGFTAYWAVAEHEAMSGNAWKDLPRLFQGSGTLGERMAAIYRQLLERDGFALLVGADAPQLRDDALAKAAHWLDSAEPRLVIGRARDGGFWLFGGNVPLPPEAWLQPSYSEATTGHEFIRSMSPYGEWLELEMLCDVDRVEDLAVACGELRALPAPTHEQQRLLEWMQDSDLAAENGA